RIAPSVPHHRPREKRPNEKVVLEQDDGHEPRATHSSEHRLNGRPQLVDRLMMAAFRAVKLKNRAVLAAILRQSIKAIAAPLAKDRQLLAEGSALWRSQLKFINSRGHLVNGLNVQPSTLNLKVGR